MRTDAQKKADKKYERKIYCMTSIKTKREICLNGRIENAANAKGMSKNAFLLYAIEKELSANGYGRDTITQQDQE